MATYISVLNNFKYYKYVNEYFVLAAVMFDVPPMAVMAEFRKHLC